jgi:hypothetical protein
MTDQRNNFTQVYLSELINVLGFLLQTQVRAYLKDNECL